MKNNISIVMNVSIVLLLALFVLTTQRTYAGSASVSDASGGISYGNTYISTVAPNDFGNGSTYRQPTAAQSVIQLDTFTTCGGYLHQIGGVYVAVNNGSASAQTLAGSTQCVDSTQWYNQVNGYHRTFGNRPGMKYADFGTNAAKNRSR